MNFVEYLEEKKELYHNLLEYLDNGNINDDFKKLTDIFDGQSIKNRQEDLNTLFHLIVEISNHHHRVSDFFPKIENIISYFIPEIQKFYSNIQIFNLFEGNKRILLFLIEKQLLKFDKTIVQIITSGKYKKQGYPFYFYPEIKSSLSSHMINKAKKMPEINSDDFEFNRKRAENHHYLCQLIQKDSIDEFIVYINRSNISPLAKINKSIFETNSNLINMFSISLLEYSAFYGSLQIFKYLLMDNNSEIKKSNSLLWMYSIHGRNHELIHLIEEYKVPVYLNSYESCLNGAINCHHNEIAQYIEDNLLNDKKCLSRSVKCFNFDYFPDKIIDDKFSFHFACKYDNPFIVKNILDHSNNIDINEKFKGMFTVQTGLSAAIEKGNNEVVRILLSNKNIDVNVQSVLTVTNFVGDSSDDEDEEEEDNNLFFHHNIRGVYKKIVSPLHEAVIQGNEEVVKLLLSNPNIDVNNKLEYHDFGNYGSYHIEKTALHIAIEKGYTKIVELLLSHPDVNVNQICRHNDGTYSFPQGHDRYIDKIPLILAVENENIEIVKLLLNHPKIDVNISSRYHDFTYIGFEGYKGNEYQERNALQIAVIKNNIEIIRLLLGHSTIDVNSHMILYKFNSNKEEESKYQTDLYMYFDSNEDDNYGFYFADLVDIDGAHNIFDDELDFHQYNEIQFRKLPDSNVEREEKTPLLISVENQNIDSVQLLLDCQKVDINCKCTVLSDEGIPQKVSALHQALQINSIKIAQFLQDKGGFDILETSEEA